MLTPWENSYFVEKERSVDGVQNPAALQNLQLEKVEFRNACYAGLAYYGEEACKEMMWSQYNKAMDTERN